MEPNRELDLRGEVCPYTLVKTILVLEEMQPGQVLSISFDYARAADEVPRSVSMQGHQVLNVQQASIGAWTVTVRKGGGE